MKTNYRLNPLFALLTSFISVAYLFYIRGDHPCCSMFWSNLSRKLLKAFGWELATPPTDRKYVAVGAPHTTNWDLPLTFLLISSYRVRFQFMMKASLFKGPLGPLARRLGGISIYRDRKMNLVEQAAQAIKEADDFVLGIPAEGTRKHTDFWKSGFYHIATQAEVPVHFGFIDYKAKRLGMSPGFVPTGDITADMDKVRAFYEPLTPKFPAQKSRILLKAEVDGPH